MRAVFFLFTLSFLFGFTQISKASEIEKQTYIYAVYGKDTLYLDKYEMSEPVSQQPRTTVVFAFGGGFRGGDRARSSYEPYFHYLANEGYVVISTDYRTTLSNISSVKIEKPQDYIPLLQNAIQTAVSDFYCATSFVLQHKSEWNINPEMIIASGSSAGAITASQAVYGLCNGFVNEAVLPKDFKYAGLISFAGAICSPGPLKWTSKPAPCLLFHGDADSIVPFKEAVIGQMGLYGSSTIDASLDSLKVPHQFFQFRNCSHEIADTPMQTHLPEIGRFISRFIEKKDSVYQHIEEVNPGKEDVFKDYKLEDYLKANVN